jgi:Na+/H+-dicarboxylate symporter
MNELRLSWARYFIKQKVKNQRAVGFQDADVAVIIGTMLAVDRPLDMMRTMVNIFSDSIGASVIAKSEGETLYPN